MFKEAFSRHLFGYFYSSVKGESNECIRCLSFQHLVGKKIRLSKVDLKECFESF